MAAKHLLEHGDGAQAWGGLQHGNDLGPPDQEQRIGPPTATWGLPLRGQTGIGIEARAGGGADPRPGGGNLAGVGPALVHVQSRLLVGDVRAGHEAIPWGENRHSGTNLTPSQAGPPERGTDLAAADLRQGYAPPPVSPGNHHPD